MREVTPDELGGSSKTAVVIGPFGSNLKTSDFTDSGVPLIFVRDIRAGDFSEPRAFVSAEKARQLRAHVALPGDLVVTKMGDPPGDVAIYDGPGPAVITADCIRLRPTGDYDARYLLHAFKTPRVRQQVLDITSGAAQKKVSLERFRHRVTVPAPPLPEQRRIAAILDHADALRAKRRQVLTHLEALPQSLYQHVFGDPARNPYGFPMRSIRSIAEKFRDGPFGSNLKSSHYVASGVPVVRLQNIGVGKYLDHDRAFVSDDHYSNLSKHDCKPGDVLIGTLGDPNLRACIQPDSLPRALNKADCIQFRPNPEVATSAWACWLLNMPGTLAMASALAHGQTRTRISMGQLRELQVPVPPLSLQRKFASALSALEAQHISIRSAISTGEELFTALQSRAFRGEL